MPGTSAIAVSEGESPGLAVSNAPYATASFESSQELESEYSLSYLSTDELHRTFSSPCPELSRQPRLVLLSEELLFQTKSCFDGVLSPENWTLTETEIEISFDVM